MFKSVTMSALLFISTWTMAQQFTFTGKIIDSETQEPLFGALVTVEGTQIGTTTAEDGSFNLSWKRPNARLTFSFVGFESKLIDVSSANAINVKLIANVTLEEVIIQGVRAENTAPIAKSEINKKELEEIYNGEHPVFYLENTMPSILSFSESGTRINNYGSMRLRGISQERINMTINGIPLNDMIDHGVFFSNFTDVSNSFESVQVQRGVGTSSNGVSSYAGSINFETINLSQTEAGGKIQLGAGSFNSYRANAVVNTGLIDNKWAFHASYSKLSSDGYKRNTYTNANSFFFSGGYFGEKDLLKVNVFTAQAENGLGYAAIAKSILDDDPRTNDLNENDIDNFGQNFVQFQYSRALSGNSQLVSSFYYGGAGGDFFYTYPNGSGGLDQINYPLQNNHYGVTTNYIFDNENWSYNLGIHTYTFRRENREEITPDFGNPYYQEQSYKNEISAFGKVNYTAGKLTVFGDIQLRSMKLTIEPDYTFLSVADEGDIVKNWTFVNPKLGLNYAINDSFDAYVSFGRSGREPTKVDIFGGFNLNDDNFDIAKEDDGFNPEYVNDLEVGLNIHKAAFSGNINLFYMDFQDEIAPIGETIAFGVQRRRNIDESYRAGIEISGNVQLDNRLTFSPNITYMKSQIASFQFEGDTEVYTDKTPILSPEWIINTTFKYDISRNISVSSTMRYVSESFLELTNDPDLILPSYVVIDGRATLKFTSKSSFSIEVNNLLDAKYYTNGAPVDVDWDGTVDEPGYFVNAPMNIFGTLTLGF